MLRNLQEQYPRAHILLFLCFLLFLTKLVQAHIFIYAGCSPDKYQPNSPYERNLNSLLSSVVSTSSHALYTSFGFGNDSSASPEDTIYGLYQCRGDLKTRDCSTCIASAVSQIGLVCAYTYGATLQLDTCYIRYEHVDFLGKVDMSVRYEKCSKSVSDDDDFLKRRDDVLGELKSGVYGGFKVSVSGLVEGYGQCLGDLSVGDCYSCMNDAVLKLKSLCGNSAAGDVFLAQCYARYWASGYYDSSPDSSDKDEVGKTVAIIVGIVAGVAIVIVLLSFCRKPHG